MTKIEIDKFIDDILPTKGFRLMHTIESPGEGNFIDGTMTGRVFANSQDALITIITGLNPAFGGGVKIGSSVDFPKDIRNLEHYLEIHT